MDDQNPPAGEAAWARLYPWAIALVTAAGAAIRLRWLACPMRYDESWGTIMYVFPQDIVECFRYTAPNNHVLHTLLVWLSAYFGGLWPQVVRLPAFLAGIALVPACAALARMISRRRLAGLIAAVSAACSVVLIEYSVNARGYTMLLLVTVLLAMCTVRIVSSPADRWPWAAWAAVTAVGMFTMPAMIFPAAALAVVIALYALVGGKRAYRGLLLRRLSLACFAAAVLTVLLYLPVLLLPIPRDDELIPFWKVLLAGGLVPKQTTEEVFRGSLAMAGQAVSQWTYHTDLLWQLLMAIGLAAALVQAVSRLAPSRVEGQKFLYLLPAIIPAVMLLLAMALRKAPYARLWLFALPLLLAISSCGLADLTGRLVAPKVRRWVGGAIIAALVIVNAQAVWRSWQDAYPMGQKSDKVSETRLAVLELKAQDDGRTALLWDSRAPNWPMFYYYFQLYLRGQQTFVPADDGHCQRVAVVLLEGQELGSILACNPYLARMYGPPELLHSYADVKIYLCRRIMR